jgi:hypothetical protein
MQDAVNCFFNSINSSIEAHASHRDAATFSGASHLSQTSMWAEALQVRLVNRAVVPLAMHLAFDLSRDRFQRFQSSVMSHRTQDPLWLAFVVQKLPSSRVRNRR